MCFILGKFDVADEVGVGYFLPLGIACLETKNIVLLPSTRLEGKRGLRPPCSRRKHSLAVEISQVTFLGPEWRVCREDLAPVLVSITAAAVATIYENYRVIAVISSW